MLITSTPDWRSWRVLDSRPGTIIKSADEIKLKPRLRKGSKEASRELPAINKYGIQIQNGLENLQKPQTECISPCLFFHRMGDMFLSLMYLVNIPTIFGKYTWDAVLSSQDTDLRSKVLTFNSTEITTWLKKISPVTTVLCVVPSLLLAHLSSHS